MFGAFPTFKPKTVAKEVAKGNLPFGGSRYSDLLRQRTNKAATLFKALTIFHEKSQAGDKSFIEAITKLGLLPDYRACYQTERLIALVVARIVNLAGDVDKLVDLPFDEVMKPVEVMFGSGFVQTFTVKEIVEIGF